jgi:hypothetical protein
MNTLIGIVTNGTLCIYGVDEHATELARVAITDTSPESVAALVAGITPFLANGTTQPKRKQSRRGRPGGHGVVANAARAWIASNGSRPFTLDELRAVMTTPTQARNVVYNLTKSGELTRVSPGTYKPTKQLAAVS